MPPHGTMTSVPSNRVLYVAEENFEAVKPMSPIEYPNHVCIQYSYKIKFFPVDGHDELFRLSWMIIMHSLCKKWDPQMRAMMLCDAAERPLPASSWSDVYGAPIDPTSDPCQCGRFITVKETMDPTGLRERFVSVVYRPRRAKHPGCAQFAPRTIMAVSEHWACKGAKFVQLEVIDGYLGGEQVKSDVAHLLHQRYNWGSDVGKVLASMLADMSRGPVKSACHAIMGRIERHLHPGRGLNSPRQEYSETADTRYALPHYERPPSYHSALGAREGGEWISGISKRDEQLRTSTWLQILRLLDM